MLTPKFDIIQDEQHVILTLHVPYIKISESEMHIDGSEFKFYIKPYYLRLNFSNEIVEDGSESAKYDVDRGDIVINIPKKNRGEHFEDLDMISKLLAPKHKTAAPKIEVLNGVDSNLKEAELTNEIPEDFTWEWDQEYPKDEQLTIDIHYGFCNRYNSYYSRFTSEYPDLLDLPLADECPPGNRKVILEDSLLHSFDMEHYLSDFMELNELMADLLHYQPVYITNPDDFCLVEDEQKLLRQLPRVRVMVEKEHFRSALIGLVDLLFSFIFDHIINSGEVSVESAWNMCKMSSQLSWLYTPTSLHECLVLNFSHALTYPLYRHFDFCTRVLTDIKYILAGGPPRILKCLLKMHDVFRKHEFYYLHNRVYVNDYCLWVQNIKAKHIAKLCTALDTLPEITKSDLPFPLEDFEIMVDAEQTYSGSEDESYSGSSCDGYRSSSEASAEDKENSLTEELYEKTDRKVSLPPFEKLLENSSVSCLDVGIENMTLKDDSVKKEHACTTKPLIEELNSNEASVDK